MTTQQDSKPVYLSRGHLMLAASKARHQDPPKGCAHNSASTSEQNPNVPKTVAQATIGTAKSYSGAEGPIEKRHSQGHLESRKESVQGTLSAFSGFSINHRKTSEQNPNVPKTVAQATNRMVKSYSGAEKPIEKRLFQDHSEGRKESVQGTMSASSEFSINHRKTSEQNPNVPKTVAQATIGTAKSYSGAEKPIEKRLFQDHFEGRKESVQGTMSAASGFSLNDRKTSEQNPNVPKTVAKATIGTAKSYSGAEGPIEKRHSQGHLESRKESVQGRPTMSAVSDFTLNDRKTDKNNGKTRKVYESHCQVSHEYEKLDCMVCGKQTATKSCDLCALMSFCQQCFILWHKHPGRQHHQQRNPNLAAVEHQVVAKECKSSAETSKSVTESAAVGKVSKKKVSRSCVFCGQSQTNLSRHILLIHKDKEEVQQLKTKSNSEKCRTLQKFKRQGILVLNKQQMKLVSPNYQRERRPKIEGSGFTVCEHCSGCFSKKTFYAHKARCKSDSNQSQKPRAISFPLLSLPSDIKGTAFEEDVLSTIRDDEIGHVCKTDATVLLVGKRMYDKDGSCSDKKMQARKSAKTQMRRLASLFLHFKHEASLSNSENIKEVSDMLNVLNMEILERALNSYTTEEESIKAGLKESLFWLLLRTADAAKAMFLRKGKKEDVQRLDDFVICFKHEERSLFGHARTVIRERREKCLRKPENMPNQEEVRRVHAHIDKEINRLTDCYSFWSASDYLLLRDLLITQITIFNGRRGGEPARLLLHQWEEAYNDEWLTSGPNDGIVVEERGDTHDMKIAYQRGKGGHSVPVIFLKHIVKALEKFCGEDARRNAGVNPQNAYVFPATNNSLNCADGWHAVHDTICAVGLPSERAKLFTATKMRHFVSTLFAQINVPENVKQLFFQHMGHSMRTNLNSYQAPLGMMTMNRIAPLLLNLTGSNVLRQGEIGIKSTSTTLAPLLKSISPTNNGAGNSSPPDAPLLKSISPTHKEDGAADSSPADDEDFLCDIDSDSSSEEPGSVRKQRKRKRRAYLRWSKGETDTVRDYFKTWFNSERNPGKVVIEKFKELHPHFTQPWQSIRTKIINDKSNEIRRAEKRMQQVLQ